MTKEIIFIYNAKSAPLNKVADFLHKAISPKTYNCELCSLTHGVFQAKEKWIEFLKSTNLKCTFLYKDELDQNLKKIATEFPIVILKSELNKYSVLLKNNDFQKIDNIEGLIEVLIAYLGENNVAI